MQARVAHGELDDAALLDAWRSGDTVAGNELLQRNFSAVYRFFARNLGPDSRGAEAEDLAQRTFEACIERRDRVQSDFRNYLFGVARRQLYLEWQERSRRARHNVTTPSVVQACDARTSPSAVLARLDQRKAISRALALLPLEFNAVLDRFYWEDKSVQEIAEELGIAPGTVKSRLFRGKAMLREALQILRAPQQRRQSAVSDCSICHEFPRSVLVINPPG
jgi:RNA polymerase sigma-70 factor (ECF subfamily)